MKIQSFIQLSIALLICLAVPMVLKGAAIVLPIKGSGIPANKKIACAGTNQIKVGGTGTLVITQDPKGPESLTIEADDNILPKITTSLINNTLEINIEGAIDPVVPIKYQLSLRSISQIEASGSIHVTGTVNTDTLNIIASSKSTLILSENTLTQNITASGTTSFNGNNLMGKNAVVQGSGTSTISLNVSDMIDGTMSNKSTLNYLGNPMINVHTSGSAAIKKG